MLDKLGYKVTLLLLFYCNNRFANVAQYCITRILPALFLITCRQILIQIL